MEITEIHSIDQILTEPTGYYWDFPEVLFTWGNALKSGRLIQIRFGSNWGYARAQKNTCKVAAWYGEQFCPQWFGELGFSSIEFQPLSFMTKNVMSGGYNVPTWFSKESWEQLAVNDRQRRWQFRSALKRYDFIPVSKTDPEHIVDALKILKIWIEIAGQRQRLMGTGHYAACIKMHPQLENSHMFFLCDKEGKKIGLVGGYVRDGMAVSTNIKHDFSQHSLIHALWGFWLQYVHNELGAKISCNGSTSDKIKKEMHMERRLFYKPPKLRYMAPGQLQSSPLGRATSPFTAPTNNGPYPGMAQLQKP